MPQMSPLNWLSLFLMFMFLFSTAINKLYFSEFFIPQPKNLSMLPLNKELVSWTW